MVSKRGVFSRLPFMLGEKNILGKAIHNVVNRWASEKNFSKDYKLPLLRNAIVNKIIPGHALKMTGLPASLVDFCQRRARSPSYKYPISRNLANLCSSLDSKQ